MIPPHRVGNKGEPREMCDDHSYEKPDLGEGGTTIDGANGRSVPICIGRRR